MYRFKCLCTDHKGSSTRHRSFWITRKDSYKKVSFVYIRNTFRFDEYHWFPESFIKSKFRIVGKSVDFSFTSWKNKSFITIQEQCISNTGKWKIIHCISLNMSLVGIIISSINIKYFFSSCYSSIVRKFGKKWLAII